MFCLPYAGILLDSVFHCDARIRSVRQIPGRPISELRGVVDPIPFNIIIYDICDALNTQMNSFGGYPDHSEGCEIWSLEMLGEQFVMVCFWLVMLHSKVATEKHLISDVMAGQSLMMFVISTNNYTNKMCKMHMESITKSGLQDAWNDKVCMNIVSGCFWEVEESLFRG